MLTQSVRNELQTELQILKTRRDSLVAKIEAKISAIEAVLAPDDEQGILPLVNIPTGAVTRISTPSLMSNTGLSETLRKIINAHPFGVDQVAIATGAAAAGHTPRGKTSLSVLVTSELWRLVKKGDIRKAGKLYFPKSKEGNQ